MVAKTAFAAGCWRACSGTPRKRARAASDPRGATLCALGVALATLPCVHPHEALAATGGVLSSNTEMRRIVATDATAILQHALPLPAEVRGEESPPVRDLQTELEKLSLSTRARGGAARQLNARASMLRLHTLLGERRLDLLLDVPATKRAEAAKLVGNLDRAVADLSTALAIDDSPPGVDIFPTRVAALAGAVADSLVKDPAGDRFDGVAAEAARRRAVESVGDLELLMMDGAPFPYRIPRRYEALPRLLGRATLELTLTKAEGSSWLDASGKKAGRDATLTVVLDGYSAPITAGAVMQGALRGGYDSAPVLSSEKGFCVRLGEKGALTSGTNGSAVAAESRNVPFEILLDGERAPIYGATLDEAGVGDLQPALPVTAYGAMALEHELDNANAVTGAIDVFFIDPRSYTARALGGSVLTGNVATFGYVTDGGHLLPQMKRGDVVRSCRVVSGEQNYRSHG